MNHDADSFETLANERITLRPVVTEDAPILATLLGDRRVVSTTRSITYPYELSSAVERIADIHQREPLGELCSRVICLPDDPSLMGMVTLRIDATHDSAELGYWLGVPFWGRGLGSAAAQLMLDHGFRKLGSENQGLHRIEAFCNADNPASARILEKLGMRQEGIQRDGIKRWGVYKDTLCFGVLRTDLGWPPLPD